MPNESQVLSGQAKTNCTRYDVELARVWERSRLTAKVAELTKDAGKADERLAGYRAAARTAIGGPAGGHSNGEAAAASVPKASEGLFARSAPNLRRPATSMSATCRTIRTALS